jgi:hypothetical protein
MKGSFAIVSRVVFTIGIMPMISIGSDWIEIRETRPTEFIVTLNASHMIASIVLLDTIETFGTLLRILSNPFQTGLSFRIHGQFILITGDIRVPSCLVCEACLVTASQTSDDVPVCATVIQLSHGTFWIRAPNEFFHLFEQSATNEFIVSLEQRLVVIGIESMLDRLEHECDATVKFWTTNIGGEDTRKCLLNMRVETTVADGAILLFTTVIRKWPKVVQWLVVETHLTGPSLFPRLDRYPERKDKRWS